MNRVNAAFSTALASFAPPSPSPIVYVPIKRLDVDHLREGFVASDPEGWVILKPTDDELIAAVQKLVEDHSVELDSILTTIITGKKV